jgi:putative FmdB family regulatory protein
MPIYAYKCKNCDYRFDIRQRFSDEPLTSCPSCDGQIRRVISPVGVVFKGSGFYVTDNRNGSGKGYLNGKSKKTDETSTETSDSSETKAESSAKESPPKSRTESGE